MLNELGNIGNFVGGLAVVVTLVYLALQIRQNTAATRVQTVQHLLTSDTAAADAIIAGPIPEILSKLEAGESLSPAEFSAYPILMRGRVAEAWQVFYQNENGMIERHVADGLLERFDTLAEAGLFRSVWHRTLKVGFLVELREYVESRMNEATRCVDGVS